jgi:hypothetical protein
MNGRELSKASLADGTVPGERKHVRVDDVELSEWAALISGCLQTAPGTPPPGIGLGAAETAESVPAGWRPSVEDMTPEKGAFAGAVEAGAGHFACEGKEGEAPQRIQIRVNTKEFGEVALIIERAEQGLRILLGAVDGRIVSALRQEALAVRRALESGGQSVGSLEVVRMNEVGTVLAQNKLAPGNRARRFREQADTATPSDRKKKQRRINLVG